MKSFVHEWDDDIFLLHIQLDGGSNEPYLIQEILYFKDAVPKMNSKEFRQSDDGHRFIVSRTHTLEQKYELKYPDEIRLTAFKVDDRAYFPTEFFYQH